MHLKILGKSQEYYFKQVNELYLRLINQGLSFSTDVNF